MVIQVNPKVVIDNPQHYSAEVVEKLRALLAAGADVVPDSHRKDFYEVTNGSRAFYIHISPVSGTVFLLATWHKPVSRSAIQKLTAA